MSANSSFIVTGNNIPPKHRFKVEKTLSSLRIQENYTLKHSTEENGCIPVPPVFKSNKRKRKRDEDEDEDTSFLEPKLKFLKGGNNERVGIEKYKVVRHLNNEKEIKRKYISRGYEECGNDCFVLIAPYKSRTSINSDIITHTNLEFIVLKNPRKQRNLKIYQVKFFGGPFDQMKQKICEKDFEEYFNITNRYCHLTLTCMKKIKENDWESIEWITSRTFTTDFREETTKKKVRKKKKKKKKKEKEEKEDHNKNNGGGGKRKGVEFCSKLLKTRFKEDCICASMQFFPRNNRIRKALNEVELKLTGMDGKTYAASFWSRLETGDQREPNFPEGVRIPLYRK